MENHQTDAAAISEMEQLETFKELSKEHKIFVLEMIAHGHRQDAYNAAYPYSSRSSSSSYNSACRLLAVPAIKQCIQYAKLQAYTRSIENMQQQYDLALATVFEKRGALAQIIRGQMQHFKDKDASEINAADIRTIMRAISLDSQLEVACNRFL